MDKKLRNILEKTLNSIHKYVYYHPLEEDYDNLWYYGLPHLVSHIYNALTDEDLTDKKAYHLCYEAGITLNQLDEVYVYIYDEEDMIKIDFKDILKELNKFDARYTSEYYII